VIDGSPKLKRELNQPVPNAFALAEKSFRAVVHPEVPPVFVKRSPDPLPKVASAAAAVAAAVAIFFAFCAAAAAAVLADAAAPFTALPADAAAPFIDDVKDEKSDGFAGAAAAGEWLRR
jgi:hypothetical protein